MHQASLHGGSLPRSLPGHIWGISVWKLWNIRASEEVKKQMADSRNMESIEIIENIEKKLQKQMAKIVLEAWKPGSICR